MIKNVAVKMKMTEMKLRSQPSYIGNLTSKPEVNRWRIGGGNNQWCGRGSFYETKTEAEAALTRPRRGEVVENQAEARPRQGSQKTM